MIYKRGEGDNIVGGSGQAYTTKLVGVEHHGFLGCCTCDGTPCAFRDLGYREDCPDNPSCVDESLTPFIWVKVEKQ